MRESSSMDCQKCKAESKQRLGAEALAENSLRIVKRLEDRKTIGFRSFSENPLKLQWDGKMRESSSMDDQKCKAGRKQR